jgi:hypothetical protein
VTFIFASADSRDEAPAPSIETDSADVSGSPVLSADVGSVRQGSSLTPDQREAAIKLAGDLVVKYMDEYERTGCFAALGNADRFRLMQRQLIAGRTNPQERTE